VCQNPAVGVVAGIMLGASFCISIPAIAQPNNRLLLLKLFCWTLVANALSTSVVSGVGAWRFCNNRQMMSHPCPVLLIGRRHRMVPLAAAAVRFQCELG
jgi:hypothetical protein